MNIIIEKDISKCWRTWMSSAKGRYTELNYIS